MKRSPVPLIGFVIISIIMISCGEDFHYTAMDADTKDSDNLDISMHNTSTSPVEVAENEVLFSFTLSGSKETSDAIVYYSAGNMEFENSVYLTAGLNINEQSLEEGPSPNGVKAALPNVCIRKETEMTYYFKIVRLHEEEKIVHFAFEMLECGSYRITDSNRADAWHDFTYYIKANEEGDPCYINVKFY